MSRSNPDVKIKNIAQHFITWSSDNKCFSYFKKYDEPDAQGKKGEDVLIKIPLTCLVLDVMVTIKGWNDDENASYYSNEVRFKEMDESVFNVRIRKNNAATGTYKEVKALLPDAKFAYSVYVCMKEDGKLIIANLQFVGTPAGEWYDFMKKNDVYKDAIKIAAYEERKKGSNTFYAPVFSKCPTTPETDLKAKELDKELQAYLLEYLKPKVEAPTSNEPISKGEQSANLHNTSYAGNTPEHTENDLPPEQEDNSAPTEANDLPF